MLPDFFRLEVTGGERICLHEGPRGMWLRWGQAAGRDRKQVKSTCWPSTYLATRNIPRLES